MVGHPSSDPVFAACLRLFRDYPLAVRRHYAEHRYGSLILRERGVGGPRFFVLIMERDDLFVIRPWDRRDCAAVEVLRGEPVPAGVRRVIESGVPVPRDGTLLGWLAGRQVQAVVAAYGRLTEPWDDPSAVPGILVMPFVGSQPADWPPFAAAPLNDRRLWQYLARGQLADLTPLVSRQPGCMFWVPGAAGLASRRPGARVVVTERLDTEKFWLPAAVYADYWTLREGTPRWTSRQLPALSGVTDMARALGRVSRATGRAAPGARRARGRVPRGMCRRQARPS